MWTKGNLNQIWQRHADRILAEIPAAELARGDTRITRLLGVVAKSPLGSRLLDHAKSSGIAVMFDAAINYELQALYYPELRVVILSTDVDDNALVGAIAHELRHAWQDSQGFLVNSVIISPLSYLVKSRLAEADATACQLQVLAELSARMIRGPWREARDNPTFFAGDCLQAFKEYKAAGNGNLASYGAMGKAFEEWFLSGIKHDYDMRGLQYYMEHHKEIAQNNSEISCDVVDGAGVTLFSRMERICHSDLMSDAHGEGIAYEKKETFLSLGDTLDGKSYIEDVIDNYLQIDDIFGPPNLRKTSASFKKAEKLYKATLALG